MKPSFGINSKERIQGCQVFEERIKFKKGEGRGGGRCSKCLLQMDVDAVEANTNFSKTRKRFK